MVMYRYQVVNTLVSLLFCPIIIRSVLSTLSFNLLGSTHDKMSVRQSFIVDIDVYVYLLLKVIYKPVCHRHIYVTFYVIVSNDSTK